jgi:hypothetical protein
MNRKRICLFPTQRLDFWLNVAALLHEEYDIVLVLNAQTKAIAEKRIPGKFEAIEVLDPYLTPDQGSETDGVVAEALEMESRYNVTMAKVMSTYRDLGKGYIFNADRHPDMTSSWWSHEHKLTEVTARFRFWEGLLDRHDPSLILCEINTLLISTVAKHRGIPSLGLGFMKLGDRYFWTENCHYQSRAYYERVRENVGRYLAEPRDFPVAEYQEVQATKYLDSKIDNGFRRALADAGRRVYRETRHRVKRLLMSALGRPLPKVPGYRYLGWLPVELRRPFMFRYMQAHGKTPDQLAGYKLVYVPMHLEPEVALMAVSPEFNNTMEMVSLLSKSLPADHLIVLKENIVALGIRSQRYYDHLRRISNVVFANLSVSSWEWIKRSEFTTTITGTAAIEAVYFLKPVLSFGRHQVVNLLPSVRYATDYESICAAVRELLALAGDEELLKVSRAALHQAQLDSSFEMANSGILYDGGKAGDALARLAVDSLFKEYGEVLEPARRRSEPV